MAESKDFAKQQSIAERIIRSAKIGSNVRCVSQELQENYISGNYKEILEFLCGDFDLSMERCCNVGKALGWSGKFVKCGLPLFLLLLLKCEDLGSGCKNMAGTVVHYMGFDVDLFF